MFRVEEIGFVPVMNAVISILDTVMSVTYVLSRAQNRIFSTSKVDSSDRQILEEKSEKKRVQNLEVFLTLMIGFVDVVILIGPR